MLVGGAGFWHGCAGWREPPGIQAVRLGRDPPLPAHVASLGNLRTGARPTEAARQLALILFGAEPDPPLSFIKPSALAARGEDVLVCDAGHAGVLCVRGGQAPAPVAFDPAPGNPAAISPAPDGDWLVADLAAGAVLRYDASGRLVRRYTLPSEQGPLRPAGVTCVVPQPQPGAAVPHEEVWVSNLAAHRLEVFAAREARWLRSIGGRGRGPGEFGFPLGLWSRPGGGPDAGETPALPRTSTAEGEIYAVDMLNCRVQVFDAAGQWLRALGAPGNQPGFFGRPRHVAVGPDGVIFVTDAASQRVHALSHDGWPIATFGAPDEDPDPLAVPAGLTISTTAPPTERQPPPGFEPSYYVLVAEQMRRPGVRVFAWREGAPPLPPPERPTMFSHGPRRGRPAAVENPHWTPDGCAVCHRLEDGRPVSIAPENVDALCLSCHDGRAAVAEVHPIGWPAHGPRTRAPPGWPLVEGRVGCLTCHDIRRHCDPQVQRPLSNSALVRGFDSRSALSSCRQCHVTEISHLSPHAPLVSGTGQATITDPLHLCGFCHLPPYEIPSDGRRRHQATLRDHPTRLCLNCHLMHPDPAPGGHLDMLVPPEMLAASAAGVPGAGRAGSLPDAPADTRGPLPLADGRITCSTCHNPHPAGLFPVDSELGARATSLEGAVYALRREAIELCVHCHPK